MASQVDPALLKLLQLGALVQSSITSYLEHSSEKEGKLPSRAHFDAQRSILAASGALTELVSDPSSRLLEVSTQYFEARALHIAAEQRFADVFAAAGEDGISVQALAERSGIEPRKLSKLSS